ncbi:hypothetical protein B0O80DRAFT_502084 [Mortierella sp. GBAus27b]|nr:hypothetical protein BGX31_005774 [Mortierella sp. GBA43]KAI8348404.1 hypothetical protein B0O80DRAFT_502084 [Mortierella sp. GBAus27b]
MDLPEIRTEVARFLENPALYSAALVCKSWNASFTPFLYRAIKLPPFSKRPTTDAVRSNADHIRSLNLSVNESVLPILTVCAKNCNKLESICIRNSTWSMEGWFMFSTLVQRNPNIRSIDITDTYPGVPMDSIRILSSLLNLRKLWIEANGLETACMELLFNTVVGLEDLHLSYVDWFPDSFDKWPCFPKLKRLDMAHIINVPAQLQLEFIRRCPELNALSWSIQRRDPHLISDICDIFKTYCPSTEELKLYTGESLLDKEIAQIVDSCHRLTSLHISQSNIGETAFRSLTRHFPFLKELHLGQCRELTSGMIQKIMTNCSNLTLFHGTLLLAQDILGIHKAKEEEEDEEDEEEDEEEENTGEGTVKQQDWVCTRLELLNFSIGGLEGKPQEWHQQIFHQLGKLTRLRDLYLNRYISGNDFGRDGLDFRLGSGLGELSGLKQLSIINFGGLWQDMMESDVIWMAKSWPKLSWICNNLCDSPRNQLRLKRILEDSGVLVYCPNEQYELGCELFSDGDYESDIGVNGDHLDGEYQNQEEVTT